MDNESDCECNGPPPPPPSGASKDEHQWIIYDAYCGLGGFTSGALQAFEAAGIENVKVVGVDCDKTPLCLFKQNASAAGMPVKTICKTIGTDEVAWPEENGRLIIHWSPSCQPFSKARAASPADPRVISAGINQIRMILDLILTNRYKRWTIEEVSHPQITNMVKEYSLLHPKRIAFDVIDAVGYGCASERRRLIVTSPAILKDLKTLQPLSTSSEATFSLLALEQ